MRSSDNDVEVVMPCCDPSKCARRDSVHTAGNASMAAISVVSRRENLGIREGGVHEAKILPGDPAGASLVRLRNEVGGDGRSFEVCHELAMRLPSFETLL